MADHDFTLKGNTEIKVDKKDLDSALKSATKIVDDAVKQIESDGKRVKSVFDDLGLDKTAKSAQDTAKAVEQEATAISNAVAQSKTLLELEQERERVANRITELEKQRDDAKASVGRLETARDKTAFERGTDSRAYQNAEARLERVIQLTNERTEAVEREKQVLATLDAQIANKRATETTTIQPESVELIQRALEVYSQYKDKLDETAQENAKVLQAQMESADRTTILVSKTGELQSALDGLVGSLREVTEAEAKAKEEQASMDIRSYLGIEQFKELQPELIGVKQTIQGLAQMYENLSNLPAPEFTSELMGIAEVADNTKERLLGIVNTWQKIFNETSKGLSGDALDAYISKAEEANQAFVYLFQELEKLPQMQFSVGTDDALGQQIEQLKTWRDELGRVIANAPQSIQGALQGQLEGVSHTIETLEQKLKTINETNRARSSVGDIQMGEDVNGMVAQLNNLKAKSEELKAKLAELEQIKQRVLSGEVTISNDDFAKLNQEITNTNTAISETANRIKSVEQEISVFGKSAQTAEFSIIQLIQRLNELKTQRSAMDKAGTDKSSQEYQNIERQINNAEAGIRQYYSELNNATRTTNGVTNATERLASAVRSVGNSKAGLTVGDIFNSVTSGAKRGYNAVMKLVSALKSLAGGLMSKIKRGFDNIGGSAEKAFSTKTLKRNLTTLLKYTLGVRSLYFAFRRLRSALKEGIDNLVQFQSATNETNHQMTEFKTSMLYLKNAWAAAFAPVINVVMPILTALMDALATVGNAVARFFAALTGQSTVIQALRVSVGDYADSLAGAGGSAKKAADEQKKLNDRLAAFDDLNVLGKDKDDEDESPSGGGGGGGLNTPSVNEMFERIETPMNRLAEMLREAWETGDGFELGKTIATSLSEGFDKAYQWLTGEGYQKAMKIANLIGTFIDGFLDVDDLGTNFGKMFGAAIVLGLDFINKVITPERLYKVGVRIAEALNAAIPMIVPKLGKTLGNLLSSAINGIYGFISTADFVSWGKSFGEAINNFFKEMGKVNAETGKTGWETLGASLHDGLRGAMIFAISALNELDTQEIVDAIAEFFDGLDLSSLKPVFEVLVHKIWETIKEIVANSPEIQKGLTGAIGIGAGALAISTGASVLGTVGSFALQGAITGIFSKGIAGALGGQAVTTAMTNTAGQAMAEAAGSTAVSTGFGASIRAGFVGAKAGIAKALSGVGEWLFGGFGQAGLETSALGNLGIGSGLAGVLDVGAGALGIATIVQGVQGLGNRLGDIAYEINSMDATPLERAGIALDALGGGTRELLSNVASIPSTISEINELDLSFSDLAEGARIAWQEIANPDAADDGVEWASRMIGANEQLYDSYTDWDGIEEARQERVRNMLNGMQEDYANYYGQMGREAVGIAQSIDFAYQTLADNEAQREQERQSRVQAILTKNSINEGQRSIAEYYQMLGEAELLQERVDMINQGYREMAERYQDLAQRENLIASMNDSYREMAERAAETARQSQETSTAIANSFNEASVSVTSAAETMERESADKFASIGSAFTSEIQDKAVPVATTVTDKFSTSFIAVGEASKQGAMAVSENFGLAFESIDQNATDTWNSIKETLSEGGDMFVAFSDGMNSTMKSLLNGLIDGLNRSITQPLQDLTKALNSIRNLDVDGNKPFAGIPYLVVPTIPHLAQGAVIPPNKEFMAVLGDQKNGTNIEAPLDTIRQAVGDELTPYLEQLIEVNRQVIQAINAKPVISQSDIGRANANYTQQQKVIRGTMV